ncbi:hypothetical protein HDU78_009526 [Chytriomyces hyalinus]|nr:hypothetical protein HDU78_009526 [Chytriomyces hyalinus]
MARTDEEDGVVEGVPLAERLPDILYDKHGVAVDGKLTKDKVIIYVAAASFVVLLVSWSVQWVALTMPQWHADAYHNAGMFECCGVRDLAFDVATSSLVPDPRPGAIHEYRCQSVESYGEDVKRWTCDPMNFLNRSSDPNFVYQENDPCVASKLLHTFITASKIFQATTTALSMLSGTSTIVFMLWPDKEPKKSSRNGLLALLGIVLTPWMCVIDLFIQNGYWPRVGVGYFQRDARYFLHGAAQASILTSSVDFFVQFFFLQWATHRYGWKLVNFNIGEVGMGPSLSFGGTSVERLEMQNRKKVKQAVDTVMAMDIPESMTRKDVERIAVAKKADINLIIEEVMAKGAVAK